MTENFIKNVVAAMQDSLTDEQLQKLENVLAINLHGLEVKEECTQLVTSERHWERILKMYIASKRLENCAESTLIAYKHGQLQRPGTVRHEATGGEAVAMDDEQLAAYLAAPRTTTFVYYIVTFNYISRLHLPKALL